MLVMMHAHCACICAISQGNHSNNATNLQAIKQNTSDDG